MKRGFWLTLLLILTLSFASAEETFCTQHVPMCSDSGVCGICGASIVAGDEVDNWIWHSG